MAKQASIKQQINDLQSAIEAEEHATVAALSSALASRKLTDAHKSAIEQLMEGYEAPESNRGMAAQLAKYRDRYESCVTANNAPSLNNGDAVAKFLAGKTWEQVCELADKATGSDVGTHAERYAGLNPGQRRMNAGNRLRALWKKGDWQPV